MCFILHTEWNSQKGFRRYRISCLLHYIYYRSIPLDTNSRSDIIRTLFENSPVFFFFFLIQKIIFGIGPISFPGPISVFSATFTNSYHNFSIKNNKLLESCSNRIVKFLRTILPDAIHPQVGHLIIHLFSHRWVTS